MERRDATSFIVPAVMSISTAILGTAVPAPALAESYPFCLLGNEALGTECDFTSLEQCRATASGTGSSCAANPAYAADAYDRHAHRRTKALGEESRE
jgi:hypothetical protein